MLINYFVIILSEMYYCIMEAELTEEKNIRIILEDNRQFFYTSKPVEITNALGAVIAILKEYSISNTFGENYKLYKTKEGNWYDIAEANPIVDNSVLMSLKFSINSQENKEVK